MKNISGEIRNSREDHYFLQQDQRRIEEMRRKAAREAETLRLMEAFGIRDKELVRELEDAGFDMETFRLLYLVPLIQVAWSDGGVSQKERDQILEVAGLHGIKKGSAAHSRLARWLTERPSDRFFQACLHGIRAMLRHRPEREAQSLCRDLVWYCTRIASASGGFFGLGSKVSREEELLLARLAAELDAKHHAAASGVSEELGR